MVAMQEMLFEWDEWKDRAVRLGVAEDLAELGKSLMRDAYMQRWPDMVLTDCGWDDDGFAMLAMAREKPAETRRHWERLYAQYHQRPSCPLESSLAASRRYALAPLRYSAHQPDNAQPHSSARHPE